VGERIDERRQRNQRAAALDEHQLGALLRTGQLEGGDQPLFVLHHPPLGGAGDLPAGEAAPPPMGGRLPVPMIRRR
jgi:hypothetical protein